jgi:PAS domain S-box-containing protein
MTEARGATQPAIAATLATIVIGAVLAVFSTVRVASNDSRVAHTYDVKSALSDLLASVTDAETGQRGFIITGDAIYLQPYSDGTARTQRTLDTLDVLTRDNVAQQRSLADLRVETARKLEELARTIQVRRDDGFQAAQQVVRTNVGQATMARVRTIVAEMGRHEDALLAARSYASVVSLRVAIALELATAITALILVGVAARASHRRLTETHARSILAHRLAAIVESSNDAIIGKDLTGVVTSWNKCAERTFGYAAEDMIGQSIRRIIPPDRQHEEDHLLDTLRRGESVTDFETIRVRRDGTQIPISLTVSPIRDEAGVVIGASKIARDITERQRAQSAISRATAEAEQANRLKDEFLATLSHELRTPLNAILGYARMLRTGSIETDRQSRALEILERNATSLSRIVEDVLDVSRIITGKTRLDVQPVDLVSVIDDAVATVRPAAEAKGVKLQAVLDRQTPAISGDPSRLQKVFWNILANAVKFTPRDGRVQVRLARVNSHIEVVVSDTGIGIAPDFLPHVFDRFRQADSQFSRQQGGLGLGLAICRHLIELHGGLIYATSDGEGLGSTFRVTLPTMIVHADHLLAAPREHPRSERRIIDRETGRLDGVRVFAVDDESDALTLLREILEQAGAQVTTCSSADKALDAIQIAVPDVLITDLGMPGTDGFELIRRIRQWPDRAIREMPVAALTAYARSEDRTRTLRSGFHMHLSKPIDPNELVAAVEALVRRGDVSVS